MSRLRARTWTQRERVVMKWWRMNAEHASYVPEYIAERAERIKRMKGVDLPRACRRALGDAEKYIDPVTGISYEEMWNIEGERSGKRTRDRTTRLIAWNGRIELSRYANRKYPKKRPAPVSRVQISAHEDWFLMERWVPSENPNIFVKVRLRERTTITKTEIRPADAPEGTPWEVLA